MQPGEWVVVLGMGGVVFAAVQIASALGGRVVAVSRSQEKLDQARLEGAVATVQAGEKTTEAIRDVTRGGAHVSIDALGITATTVPGILDLGLQHHHDLGGVTGDRVTTVLKR